MAKLTTTDLANLQNENSAVNSINNNFAAVETAMENTLSRDGTSPNTMAASLDMDSNTIINLPEATTDTEPVRKAEFDDAISNITAEGIALPSSGLVAYNHTDATAVARTFEAVVGSGITITNGDGVSGNPTFDFDSGSVTFTPAIDAISGLTPAADKISYYTGATTAATTDLSAFGRTLIDDAAATNARTTLGLVIGTDVEAHDATLTALAGVTTAADELIYATGSDTFATTPLTTAARSLLDDATTGDMRTTLGLTIGTDVQAYDAQLADIAATTPTKGKLLVGDGTNWNTVAVGVNNDVLTADSAQTTGIKWAAAPGAGSGLADAYNQIYDGSTTAAASGADTIKFRAGTGLSVTVGSNDVTHGDNVLYSISDAELTALAGLTSAADKVPYFTGSGTAALGDLSSYGRTLIDDADAATARTTLGLATVASSGSAADLSSGTLSDSRLSTTALSYGTQEIWVPASGMISATTNGPAAGTVETTTNKVMLKTLDFDATTAEIAQFAIAMPAQWDNGTVTAKFYWSHAATTTNFGVAWDLSGVAFSDGDAQDTAFGTVQTVTDTGGTTNTLYVTSASSAITIAGTPAAGDLVYFRVRRAPSNGSDTMAVDARLHGVKLFITTTQGHD